MPSYRIYPVHPLEHAMSTNNPAFYIPSSYSPLILNGKIDKSSFQKRWGYTIDRTLDQAVHAIVLFTLTTGTRYTLYLTETDLCKKETATGKTYSYLTPTYTGGSIASMSGPKTVITGGGTSWATNVAAGDKFIMNTDHTSDAEPDTDWATIQSVDSDTQITLTSAYTGATTSGNYKIRKVYSVPEDERWTWCIVKDKFCFTNGNVNVQYWDGAASTASSLDSTNAVKARYCMEYGNRLMLGDVYVSGIRQPLTIQWSMEDTPTNWTDPTAGQLDLFETDDFLTGMGRVGPNMILYKSQSTWVYGRTGDAFNPFQKVLDRRGIGCIAPYSIVDYWGTNYFLGQDDFYFMNSDFPNKVGDNPDRHSLIMHKFFEDVSTTERKRVWGMVNQEANEISWFANASTGKFTYTYNTKHDEWYMSQYPDDLFAFGRGAV